MSDHGRPVVVRNVERADPSTGWTPSTIQAAASEPVTTARQVR